MHRARKGDEGYDDVRYFPFSFYFIFFSFSKAIIPQNGCAKRIAKSERPSVPEAGKTKSDVLSEKEKSGKDLDRDSRGRELHRVKAIDPLFSYPPSPRVLAIRCPFLNDNNPLLSRSTQRNGEKVSIELILGLVPD